MSAMKQKNAALQELEQIKYSSHGGAERFYTKDIQAYDAWHDMLLDESLANTDGCDIAGSFNEELYSRLPVQKDVIQGLMDDRNQEAKYLLELAARQKEGDGTQLEQAARHFQKVSAYTEEILYLIGERRDMDDMLRHLADRKVREELAKLVLYAKEEDVAALQCLKDYLR